MNVEQMIYQLVEDATNTSPLTQPVTLGIKSYIRETRLDEALSKAKTEASAKKALEAYMTPILRLPTNQLLAYFETADIRKRFSSISNRLLQEAKRKLSDTSYRSHNVDALSKELDDIIPQIRGSAFLASAFEQELSDCLIERAFLAEDTGQISLRLSRFRNSQ